MSNTSLSKASADKQIENLDGRRGENGQTCLESHTSTDALEPIALIGMSLRFPQDAVSPDKFWQLLVEGRSALTEIPKDRFNLEAFYHPDASRCNALNIRGGHFIRDDIAAFDAPFFSMSPSEASCVDPQQRGLLECAYRALENAGITVTDVAGSKTSVFVGSFSREYETVLLRDPELQAKYMATGTGTAMLANRLSWFFNLGGPSVAIDTACSSSLFALHSACQSLRSRESAMALVAGCNLLYNPDLIIPMKNLNFLSPDSKCYSFDHRANGYSRGEGFGVVVVKPLSKALQDGNTIRAIIRATGTNQDGRTPGITQPSSAAQERLIRETYREGGIDLKTTRFFEAHGTGTPTGDPIEARAIGAVFSSQRSKHDPLFVGALKSNIGHLEGASGIAGLIKTVLVLEKGVIPPNTWFERANPKILLDDWNIRFPLETIPWPTNGLRRASVNSFGFGGSNVHVVLDDAYHYLKLRNLLGSHHTVQLPRDILGTVAMDADQQPLPDANYATACRNYSSPKKSMPRLLVWSTSDEGGIDRLTCVYRDSLAEIAQASSDNDAIFFEDLVYTVCEKRSSLAWKSFTVADSLMNLQRRLEKSLSRPIRSSQPPNLAFVFTGQGAQWHGMGSELLIYPKFRESLESAHAFLQALGCRWNIIEILSTREGQSKLNDPEISQPLCTALQLALVDLLRSWRIIPSAVVGHSSGEIAAAYCMGSLSQESAWKIAYYRGILSAQVAVRASTPGAMLSVGLSKAKIVPILSKLGIERQTGSVSLGCINSPNSVTLTGAEERIDDLKRILEQQQVFVRKLKVGVAYHSVYMDQVATEYERLLADLTSGCIPPKSSTVSMFSTVSGGMVDPGSLREGRYWVKNLTSPVEFMDAINSMISHFSGGRKLGFDGGRIEVGVIDHILEVGPHSTLQGPLKDILKSISKYETIGYSSLLSRGVCGLETCLTTAGRLHCMGCQVDLMEVNQLCGYRSPRMLINLPEYPFNHSQRYWLESRMSEEYRFRKNPPHELLGTTVRDWNSLEPRWRHFIRESENPWLNDHKVNGSTLYPASGMLVMAIEAIRQLHEPNGIIKGYHLKEVMFVRAIQLSEGQEDREVSFVLRPHSDEKKGFVWHEFRLMTFSSDRWVENCKGIIGVEQEKTQDEVDGGRQSREYQLIARHTYEEGRGRCSMPIERKDLYEKLSALGYGFGSCFQTLNEVHCNEYGEATAVIRTRDWHTKVPPSMTAQHVIHPTALDGIFQTIFPGLSQGGGKRISTLVPTRVQEMWVSNHLLQQEGNVDINVYSKSEERGPRLANSAIIALDASNGEARVVIEGLQTTAVADTSQPSSDKVRLTRLCYNLELQPDLDLLSNDQVFEYFSKASDLAATDPDAIVEEVELACFLSIYRTLQNMSQDMIPSDKPHLLKYFAWMKHQVERYNNGLLIHGRPEWKLLTSDLRYKESLFERVEMSNPEGKLCITVAKNLSAVLKGELESLELLFSGTQMDEFYRWSIESEKGFARIAGYLDTLIHKHPCLNILEIGAGTGSGTESVMEVLKHHGVARYRHYTFTDISPSFFEIAREAFASEADRMTFRVLDISLDPLRQGFEPQSYDLVLAVNVLHATPNLDITMQNTRKLMKPGAKLILFELCNPAVLRSGFVFGQLPGWWLATEDYREWGPILSEKGWHKVLTANGFSGTDVTFRDNTSERTHQGSAMLSTALDEANGHSSLDFPETVIVAAEGSVLQQNLASELRSQLLLYGVPRCDVIDAPKISFTNTKDWYCISLLELESPMLSRLDADRFEDLRKIVTTVKSLLWITGGGRESAEFPELGLIHGFSRCIRSEYNNLDFVTLALDMKTGDRSRLVQHIVKVCKVMLEDKRGVLEKEYVEKNGVICINRIVEANYLNDGVFSTKTSPNAEARKLGASPIRALALSIGSPGLLNTIQYVSDDILDQPVDATEVEVEVKATGLNLYDIAVLLDQVSSLQIGLDCAGVVTRVGKDVKAFRRGDRVCCMPRGSYKTYTRSDAALVAKIPNSMSFVSAAVIPMAYCTAYHSLYNLGQIQEHMSILIHCGAGGVGQAAVQLAKLVTEVSNIFVTVGSNEKRSLVMDHYGILEDHVFSSRDLTFAAGVKRMTQGRGVDVVLNSLGGESLRLSMDCVAKFGRFIEIGLKDVDSFAKIPMAPFSKSITFASVDLSLMIRDAPHVLGGVLDNVMALLCAQKIEPAASCTYNYSKLEDAFRLLQGGRNLGKVVAVPHETDLVPVVPDGKPTYTFDADATYVISGGLGGLGRSITRWMVTRGARNFLLLSRSGAASDSSLTLLSEMTAKGVRVLTPACDISDERSLRSALAESRTILPPFRGCIQAAMVLKDAIFENMRFEDFEAALKPKVQGSWNLHSHLPKDLDFFILLSSLNGILGSRGQSNYGAGNTYEDALAQYRISHGEKAVSLDIGLINSVGFVAERQELLDSQLLTGLSAVEEWQLLAILEYHCDPALPLLSPLESQVMVGIETPAVLKARGLDEPYWLSQPICRTLFQMGENVPSGSSSTDTAFDYKLMLQTADSLTAAKDVINMALKQKLSKMLSIPFVDIDQCNTISNHGADSLVAVELRTWLSKEVGVEVAIFEVLSNLSIAEFSELVAGRSSFVTLTSGDKHINE